MKICKWFCLFLLIPFILFGQSTISIGVGSSISVGSGADICADSKTVDGTITGDGTWCSSLPLPVELICFTADYVDGNVIIKWQTATEVNNYGFNVERRTCPAEPGANEEWEKIGFVQGHGNSNSPKSYSYKDNLAFTLGLDLIQYRLKQIDFDGQFEYSDVVDVKIEKPAQFSLKQNYPNPFNPTTSIQYSVAIKGNVSLKIFDILGREVATLVDEIKEPGVYNSTLNTLNSPLSSGVYLYKLQSGSFIQTKKLLLTK